MAANDLPALLERPDIRTGAVAAALRAEATGHSTLDPILPGGGWPLGAISELLTDQDDAEVLRLALPLLVRLSRAGRAVALVAPPHLPYAPGLIGRGLALAQCWVVEPRSDADAAWAVDQILRTPGTGAALAWLRELDDRGIRRLQLAAESTGAVCLLVRPTSAASRPSVASLRLKLSTGAAGTGVEVLKARGPSVGRVVRLAG